MKKQRLNRSSDPRETRNWRETLTDVFAFDLRSLAFFRILLGFVILGDLALRLKTWRTIQSSAGFFTRDASFQHYEHMVQAGHGGLEWSLHWLSDSSGFQLALFGIAAIFALLLIFGCWTRLATIVSWVLVASIQVRNPVLISSADYFLKLMLMWSIFLPLGARWSVDAVRLKKKILSTRTVSWATAGFMLQLFVLYFFTGIAKLNSDWLSGDAMSHVFRLDLYITDWGKTLLSYPLVLKALSLATLVVEVGFIWIIFSPVRNGRFRMTALVVFWLFHIGIFCSMSIGLFSPICMLGWIPLVPSGFWAMFGQSKKFSTGEVRQGLPLYANVICAVLFLTTIVWNVFDISNDKIKELSKKSGWSAVTPVIESVGLKQNFQMFGESPKRCPWFVYEALLKDGTRIDLLTQQAVDHSKPDSIRERVGPYHWRRTHRAMLYGDFIHLRERLLDFAVLNWNQRHEKDRQLSTLKIFCHQTETSSMDGPIHSEVWGVYKSPDSISDTLQNLIDNEDPLMGF